ncbi:MAG: efflux RND transporter permease subunit, partial [Gammaproteobacteria bacterium]|nr:efflux RND transporter permease subunit [Gammaproteobacteria bacterium]
MKNQVNLSKQNVPGVEMILKRTESSDALKSAKILESWLEENRPKFPQGVDIQVYDESWKLINERIMVLLINGLGGLLLVIGILFLFLNGRAAFWVAAGIPVSFFATLIMMYLFGGSINMISLFGLIMAVGIIVDDAIVVAEYAMTRYVSGESPGEAAEHGARRMLAPVMSSSLTTIAAFLPLILVGGIVGKIMFEIPFVIICIVLASLIECFLILPAHMRHAFTHTAKNTQSPLRIKLDTAFERFRSQYFTPLVKLSLQHRAISLSLAIGLLIFSIGLVAGGRISFTFFPSAESKIVYANVSFTAGTPPARVKAYLQDMQAALYETDKALGGNKVEIAVINNGVSTSGQGTGVRQGDQYGSMFVELIDPDQRNFSNTGFIEAWQSRIKPVPGIELFTIAQRRGGPPGQDIDIRLTGGTPEVLKAASTELQNKLRSFTGVSAIEDDLPWGQEQIIYKLTPNGYALGLTVDEIGRQMRAAFDGQLVQVFQQGNDEIEVRIILPKNERDKISDLHSFYVYLPGGEFVPLESVATFEAKKGFDAIRHSQTLMTV